jgi:hypothetical protein
MSGCDRATHPGQVPSLRHSEEALYLFNSSTSSWQPLPHPFVALQNDQYLHCTWCTTHMCGPQVLGCDSGSGCQWNNASSSHFKNKNRTVGVASH